MTKKRKLESVKIEVKEENNEYLTAKGRLKGVLKQLTENSESDSSDDDNNRAIKSLRRHRSKNLSQSSFRSTYVMKLFDRSVDLARFEEDTPLYPICRAWMANQPRNQNPQSVIKRRYSSPEPNNHFHVWNGHDGKDVTSLPKPAMPFVSRVPSPLPEQKKKEIDEINFNYNEKPPIPQDVLKKNHIQRWVNVKKKWIKTAQKNEERYKLSMKILENIYNKAQESME